MKNFKNTLISFLFIYILLSLPAVLINCQKYDSYEKTYDVLVNEKYVFKEKIGEYFVFRKTDDNSKSLLGETILFDSRDKSVKLLSHRFLFNNIPTWFDPYTLYWRNKLWDWFESRQFKFEEYDEEIVPLKKFSYMPKREIKFFVSINGTESEASSSKDAHEKLRRSEQNDFLFAYVVRREYSQQGNLLEEFLEG